MSLQQRCCQPPCVQDHNLPIGELSACTRHGCLEAVVDLLSSMTYEACLCNVEYATCSFAVMLSQHLFALPSNWPATEHVLYSWANSHLWMVGCIDIRSVVSTQPCTPLLPPLCPVCTNNTVHGLQLLAVAHAPHAACIHQAQT